MPTGYTAGVKDGKVVTFRDFAMECARAFGALVELRDSPTAPIPDEFEVDPYPMQRHIAAQERLNELRAMDEDAIRRAAGSAYDEALTYYRQAEATRAVERERYEAMLDKVLAWEPPTPDHVEMKSFMVQQLQESIRFDCGYEYPAPTRKPPEAWHAEQIERVGREVERTAEDHEKAVERAEGRSRWVKALRESLDGEPAHAT